MLTPLHRAATQHALDIGSRSNRQQSSGAYQFFQSDSIAAIGGAQVQRSVPVASVPSSSGQVLDAGARTRQYSGATAGIISSVHAESPAGAARKIVTAAAATATAPTAATVTPTMTSTALRTPSPASATTAATATAAKPALAGDDGVVQALKDALAAAGISTAGLDLTAHQDVVTYPGGAYINRYISVEAHGHEEGLMTDLVSMNPNVAVLDIKNMLAHG